jgi:hypothetical protein
MRRHQILNPLRVIRRGLEISADGVLTAYLEDEISGRTWACLVDLLAYQLYDQVSGEIRNEYP